MFFGLFLNLGECNLTYDIGLIIMIIWLMVTPSIIQNSLSAYHAYRLASNRARDAKRQRELSKRIYKMQFEVYREAAIECGHDLKEIKYER